MPVGRLILLLLVACAAPSDAERYRAALGAGDWSEARRSCGEIRGETNRADCLVAAMERFDRLGPEDCALVPPGLWRDECTFLYAERLARAGQVPEAIAACEVTGFGRECAYHLLRAAARATVDEPPTVAARMIAPYTGMTDAHDAPRLYWKAWFREQAAADRPLDPTGCPDEPCRAAAREVLLQKLGARLSAEGPRLCEGGPVPPDFGGRIMWVESPLTRGWVDQWRDRNCVRLLGPGVTPLGGPPPPGADNPPEP